MSAANTSLGMAALAFALGVASCANINSQTNAYATLDEARRAGAVEQGLVPAWLPPGSHDIREAHVPGTASLWGIVNFPKEEGDALRAALIPEEVPLDGMEVGMPGRIEWWPIELRGALNGERLGIVGIRGYRARHNNLIVAVNWQQGRAYYWSTR
jgi:hypothetical protein